MSAASCLLTEDQFLCSICLDVFTDPVSTPCGHNFCKTCITQHWNVNVPFQCPNCKKLFYTRPELQVNTFISEMAAQFRQSAQQKASSSSSEQQAAKPGEVPCDVCTGTKLKALKSCLSFRTLNTAPPTKDWTGVRVSPPSHEGTVRRAVNQLEETLSKQMKKLLTEVELKRVQQSAVDVTLDPDTAHPNLILSDDGKQVKHVRLSLKSRPQKVGVFVDYEEGLVSFYDVKSAALIYSFTGCCFTEKLYPFFSPFLNNNGENSAPLIISPVNHTE
ncbi:hypothetical protein VZT92_006668 [Zoarces viviparus]|uniref:RING-type domain-containing protein n=1 Tax=Zoarces viviparus TaxID=48416 RepID=A0AAW1FR77_ZOAVI